MCSAKVHVTELYASSAPLVRTGQGDYQQDYTGLEGDCLYRLELLNARAEIKHLQGVIERPERRQGTNSFADVRDDLEKMIIITISTAADGPEIVKQEIELRVCERWAIDDGVPTIIGGKVLGCYYHAHLMRLDCERKIATYEVEGI